MNGARSCVLTAVPCSMPSSTLRSSSPLTMCLGSGNRDEMLPLHCISEVDLHFYIKFEIPF